MLKFFKNYGEIIAHTFTFIGLFLVVYQLYQGNENKRWENYNVMNLRYYEWYSKIPENAAIDTCEPFSKQSNETKKWVRAYFNLYSEEYWLFLNGLIPQEMWTKRIDNGVDVNLKTYPVLVRGYWYWRDIGTFNHPEGFKQIVNSKLKKLEGNLKLLNCDSLAK